jgi:hypothetical protein
MLAFIIAIFAMLGGFKRSEGIAEESEGSMLLLPVSYGGIKEKSTEKEVDIWNSKLICGSNVESIVCWFIILKLAFLVPYSKSG